jgi:hypothetical protein
VSEIKNEKQSGGSTATVPDSKPSSQSLRDGSEPDGMLLALLWSPLATLMSRNKALLATANYQGQLATVIVLVGTVPTDEGIKAVGTANKSNEVVGSEKAEL